MRAYIPRARGYADRIISTTRNEQAIKMLYPYWTLRLHIESQTGWKRRWGRRRRGKQSRTAREEDKARSAE